MTYQRVGGALAVVAGLACLGLGQGRGMGPRFGMPMPGMGFLGGGPAVTGEPFTGTATLNTERPGRDGGQAVSHQQTFQMARDGEGRTYVQTTLPGFGRRGGNGAASGAPQTVIYINDPVAHSAYVVYPGRETAVERSLRAHKDGAGREGRGHGPAQGTTTSLGAKQIAGVAATGTQRTVTRGQNTFTTTRWVNEDLHLVLEATSTSSGGGNSDYAVQTVTLGPPDASLFTIPNGYTIRQAGRGGRGAQ